MDGFPLSDQSIVELYPLHLGEPDAEQQEVGRPETGVFIGLPPEGVAIIRWLQEGLSIGAVKERFTAQFGAEPDLADFITGITECGFVHRVDGNLVCEQAVSVVPDQAEAAVAEPAAPTPRQTPEPAPAAGPRGWRLFAAVPQAWVAWLLSRPMKAIYLMIWLAVPTIWLFRPDLFPSVDDVWVTQTVVVNTLMLTLVGWTLTFLHETAHLISVRALGSTGAVALSHRLYYLVANVDMSGIRAVPRAQRYGPYLAGMTWDMAIILTCLMLQLLGVTHKLLPAITFILSMSLLFQCQFYMRTDLYYVFANRFKLGNLMEDTQRWLTNVGLRLIGRPPRHDLSTVPVRELRVVRWYAVFYSVGVTVAVGQFVLIGIPLMIKFFGTAIRGVMGGWGTLTFWDGFVFLAFTVFNYGLLMYVSRRERRSRSGAQHAA